MYKRAFSYTGSLMFLIGPSIKCSYQNMATNLTLSKTVLNVPRKPPSKMSPSCPSLADGAKNASNKYKSSRFNTKKYDLMYKKKAVVGLGFSLGLLGFFEKKEELTVEDKILMEMKRAILAIQEGEIKKAESHLDNAWKMSTEENLEEKAEKVKTQILDIRANLAFQVGDLNAAEHLFRTVCQRLVYHQEVSVKDNAIVEISIKLSQIMALKGRYEESMTGFQYCADTQKEKIEKEGVQDEDTLLLAAWSLHSLAQAYLSRGTQSSDIDHALVKKASDLATEAYNYASKAIGPDSQQALAISSDLASISALQGDIDAALERYKECEAIAAEKHTYLQAAIRVNTGSLYLQKGNYDEAERLCKEAKWLAGRYKDKQSALRAEECIVRSNDMRTENANVEVRAKKERSSAA